LANTCAVSLLVLARRNARLWSVVDRLPGNMPIGGVLSWPASVARKASNAAKPA
jgi:hypothetical protein